MDWGILQGLGQGLSIIGGAEMEQDAETRRSLLAEKLQKDREERANNRAIDAEKREQTRLETTPDPSQTRWVERDGVLFEQTRSKTGRVLEEKLANKLDMERINIEREEAKAGIQSRLSDAKYKDALIHQAEANIEQTELENARLPTRYKEESEYNAARTEAERRQNTAEDATIADFAESYIEQNPGLLASYVDTEKLTKNQVKDAVIQVLREFSRRGQKPTEADFKNAVEAYYRASPKKNSSKSGGIKMSLTGN